MIYSTVWPNPFRWKMIINIFNMFHIFKVPYLLFPWQSVFHSKGIAEPRQVQHGPFSYLLEVLHRNAAVFVYLSNHIVEFVNLETLKYPAMEINWNSIKVTENLLLFLQQQNQIEKATIAISKNPARTENTDMRISAVQAASTTGELYATSKNIVYSSSEFILAAVLLKIL